MTTVQPCWSVMCRSPFRVDAPARSWSWLCSPPFNRRRSVPYCAIVLAWTMVWWMLQDTTSSGGYEDHQKLDAVLLMLPGTLHERNMSMDLEYLSSGFANHKAWHWLCSPFAVIIPADDTHLLVIDSATTSIAAWEVSVSSRVLLKMVMRRAIENRSGTRDRIQNLAARCMHAR